MSSLQNRSTSSAQARPGASTVAAPAATAAPGGTATSQHTGMALPRPPAGGRVAQSGHQVLLELGHYLLQQGYDWVCPTPDTQALVNRRAGNQHATDLNGVFGWNRVFAPDALTPPLPPGMLGALQRAGWLRSAEEPGWLVSALRFSRFAGTLVAHSAWPTEAADAVFFGPDSYRFGAFIERELQRDGQEQRRGTVGPVTVVDLGCGSGAGGILAGRLLGRDAAAGSEPARVLFTDINERALHLARANAELAGLRNFECRYSDVLANVEEAADLIVANPPYLLDPKRRAYRHGGGELGIGLALRIVKQALQRLAPGGSLLLYTAAPIVAGVDVLWHALQPALAEARENEGIGIQYSLIDPDVFGAELLRSPYAEVERLAVIGLRLDKPQLPASVGVGLTATAARRVPLAQKSAASAATEPAAAAAFPVAPEALHRRLALANRKRMLPGFPDQDWQAQLSQGLSLQLEEGRMVEDGVAVCAGHLSELPQDVDAFMNWFERLVEVGPGQGDRLFPWLATAADMEQMRWFLTQEVAGEAGFDDLVALTQLRMPSRAKLELARNYWDEMGRGREAGMHGPMLEATVQELGLSPSVAATVWESLALANTMLALASNRRYAYHSVGALGAVELTAPGRVEQVNAGLKRLGVSARGRRYFQLHAGLDVLHSREWNREVIRPLVAADPRCARAIAEGALLRLSCGARCFERYRRELGVS